ncbi:MAG: LptF/LptG family permease, partial [Gemmatimonadota bacterium]|nr:LptF/LptG family permease [Gemmatimonadota bacterium]
MRVRARPLDRYVFGEFWKIFVTTALGFPLLLIVFDLTDNIDTYLNRELTQRDLLLSYVYWLPDSVFLILPAAVLFATVFSIGGLTRHSEITAAKASGISFYRVIAPIFAGAILATFAGLTLGELAPFANRKRQELLRADQFARGNERFNFAYSAEHGRVYKIGALRVSERTVDGIDIERKGAGPEYPSYILSATSGMYDPARGWLLKDGVMHVIPDTTQNIVFRFDSARARHFDQRPIELTA